MVSVVSCGAAQLCITQELYALTSAANDLIHLQSVIIEMGIARSIEGIKLDVHTDSASGKAMVSKLGMSKKSKHIELRYLHQNNASDILTKFMPQSTLSKHFCKVGLAETGIDEVSIQHLKTKLKTSAMSSSTKEIDVRTPRSTRKLGDDSIAVSSQETPERSEETQKCCRCEATEGLRQCQIRDCQHMSCMRHRYWVARDEVSRMALKCYCSIVITWDAAIMLVVLTQSGVQ
eukprot:4432450-Amphidinium_carterae.1